jgi:hypothetical protein
LQHCADQVCHLDTKREYRELFKRRFVQALTTLDETPTADQARRQVSEVFVVYKGMTSTMCSFLRGELDHCDFRTGTGNVMLICNCAQCHAMPDDWDMAPLEVTWVIEERVYGGNENGHLVRIDSLPETLQERYKQWRDILSMLLRGGNLIFSK